MDPEKQEEVGTPPMPSEDQSSAPVGEEVANTADGSEAKEEQAAENAETPAEAA